VGLIFCSFPLHMPGKPDTKRAQHLASVKQPMLFLSGTRDDLAESRLLAPLVESLPTATLHWLETADHSYRVLKRSRTRTDSVFDEMAETARTFIDEHASRPA
jgi:predicted alpha/beta-hydrolase family hydrolase